MEVRSAVIADNYRLTVDQKRRGVYAQRDRRESVGPIMAACGEAANALAIPAHHQPVPVMLDFMNPVRAGWWPGHLRRLAWLDEARGTPHDHAAAARSSLSTSAGYSAGARVT
jgi:hypothetical protein